MISDDWQNITRVMTLNGLTTEDDIMKAIGKHPYNAILFKDFLDTEHTHAVLEDFKNITAEKEYPLINGSHLSHFGGILGQPLFSETPWTDFMNQIDPRHKFTGKLDGIWDGQMPNVYGSFVPVGEGSMHELLNWTSTKFTPDTSFFGFLTRKVVSTAGHANWPADTVSLQLAGQKQWIIIDPLDMKELIAKQGATLYAGYLGGVMYPNWKWDKEAEMKAKLATVNSGDLLYFPPYALHVVVTNAGLNVMTALRFPNSIKALKIHPWKTAQAILVHLIHLGFEHLKYLHSVNEYAHQYDISKWDVFYEGVHNKMTHPFYNDPRLEILLNDSGG